MSAVPLRRNQTPTRYCRPNVSPIQTLLQMGFSKHRAEKALAATGNRNVQAAADWLLAHINDPMLDENEAREYVLYVCPSGRFLEQLESLWSESKELCGWNGAHNCLPHITLVSFFKAPDECEPTLSNTLSKIVEHANAYLKNPIEIELFISNTFMGLFVTENDANILKRIALQYVKEVSPSIISDTYEQLDAIVACFPWCGGVTSNTRCIPRSNRSISLEPHVKSLHLTLAYKFDEEQTDKLKQILHRLDLTAAQTWDLRLYSRDPRVASKRVYCISQATSCQRPDELESRIGDLICVTEEAAETTRDGWIDGLSMRTGCNGLINLKNAYRAPESDTWTLHKSISICSGDNTNILRPPNDEVFSRTSPSIEVRSNEWTPTSTSTTQSNEMMNTRSQGVSASFQRRLNWKPTIGACIESYNGNQKLFIMRHGERVDYAFTKWTNFCFDTDGQYHRLDLNMQKKLPLRLNPMDAWRNDSPITNVGCLQSELIGDMLRDSNVEFEFVFCSPSFRCIQTASALLKGLGVSETIMIRIEPALFEWCGWYPEKIPDFLTINELIEAGYNIDEDYAQLVTVADLSMRYKNETIEEFYERNHLISEHATKLTSKNILLVGHAANIETNSRLLLGSVPRPINDIAKLMSKVPYASLLAMERLVDGQWKIVPPNVLPISHTKNFQFEWQEFLDIETNNSERSAQQSIV